RLGQTAPLHCTAGGKVFLAFGPNDLIDRMIEAGLPPQQPNTITEGDRLREELGRVRRQGYATDIEESDNDYAALGAPILNHERRCVAAVAVAMPINRLRAAPIGGLVEPLLEAVKAISHELGHA
ncbi:MAG: IclR family transcriptional regulator, partial [Alphaproteobacteria bacterium]